MATLLVIVWGAVAILVGLGVGFMTSDSVALTWFGVFMMLLALGGVITWMGMAWGQASRRLKGMEEAEG
ncbi:MAG: hypothetical protein AAF125_18800 [Chloroflexota bacterium]